MIRTVELFSWTMIRTVVEMEPFHCFFLKTRTHMRGPLGAPRRGNSSLFFPSEALKIDIKINLVFFSIWIRFWCQNGPQIDSKNRPQDDQKTILKQTPQKHKKITPTWTPNSLILDVVFDDFLMRCMSRVCFCWHERMSKKHAKTQGFGTIFEHRPFCLNMRLSSKFDRRGSWNWTCL